MAITGAQVPRHRDRPAEGVWLFRDLPGPSILKLGWRYPRHGLPAFRVQFGSPCSRFMHHVRVSPFAASSCYILLSRLDSSPTSQKPDQGLGSICVGKSRRPHLPRVHCHCPHLFSTSEVHLCCPLPTHTMVDIHPKFL